MFFFRVSLFAFKALLYPDGQLFSYGAFVIWWYCVYCCWIFFVPVSPTFFLCRFHLAIKLSCCRDTSIVKFVTIPCLECQHCKYVICQDRQTWSNRIRLLWNHFQTCQAQHNGTTATNSWYRDNEKQKSRTQAKLFLHNLCC